MNAPIRNLKTNKRAAGKAAPGKDAPAGPAFIHLRVHSSYSLLEGALPIPRLADLAIEHEFPALALTDTNNLFGALEFSEKLSSAGIQPIIGVTLAVDFCEQDERQTGAITATPTGAVDKSANRDGQLVLLAATADGYANLMKLVSAAHLDVSDGVPPHAPISKVEEFAHGLICLTGGPTGPLDLAIADGKPEVAAKRLAKLQAMFGDRLYVELQRHGLKDKQPTEFALLDLAYRNDIPLVATNDVQFAKREDHEAHNALICIADGTYVSEDSKRGISPEHYFKTAAEMEKVFADLPEALANTVEIAQRCSYRPEGRKPILPRFVKAKENASEEELLKAEAKELKRQAEEGLKERLKAVPLAPDTTKADYEKRLAYELDVITSMKFPGYFLIVADFIKWAKGEDIPVGPGRGSGAGSVVAWALTITDLDPLRFGLLFERFLNPERVSMPDFDIDFCQDRRDEVIRYVQDKYGHDRVAQIITHGKLQARAVLRDVGRVLQMPYGQVDKLCKLVPNNPANPITLPEAIESEPKLAEARDEEPIVAQLLEISQKLEGLYRHASTHAAGMVIGDRPLNELVPLYRDPKSDTPVTQYNWKMVEAAGLVKFDFLGLKTLTVLQKAVDLVKRGRGIDIDLASTPLDDEKTYQMVARADTIGVFQLESTGMRESLKRLKPDRFEDIIAMVALYRPGPMDNIPTYINRKHGEEPVDCLHPMLESLLAETYGVIIYQEQVIQIAQVMGGYTLGQADMLRRAMGKKDKAEMARHEARFIKGAEECGVSKKDAANIFVLVNKFAGYGFNKSHAAAYALVSYHTAYMKANYREEFLAASMTLDMGNTDKLALFSDEARKSGIDVLPPCINDSDVDFLAVPPACVDEDARGAIRYSLAALKNAGAAAVESLVAARVKNGPYISVDDVAARLNPKAVNKRALETWAEAGAFDVVEPNRAAVHANVDQIIAAAQRREADTAAGTSDLFGSETESAVPAVALRPTQAWTPLERLEHEFAAIGFYLSGHPLDQYTTVLNKLGIKRYIEFETHAMAQPEQTAMNGRLAGIVVSARERRSARGNKFCFAMFSDPTGQFEAVVFADTLAQSRDILQAGQPVMLSVDAERDAESLRLRVLDVQALDAAAAGLNRSLKLVLEPGAFESQKAVKAIKDRLQVPKTGSGKGGAVRLVIPLPELSRNVELKLQDRYDVSPGAAGALATLPGIADVIEV